MIVRPSVFAMRKHHDVTAGNIIQAMHIKVYYSSNVPAVEWVISSHCVS